MESNFLAIGLLVLLVVAFAYMLSGLFGGRRAVRNAMNPFKKMDFLHSDLESIERHRIRGTVFVETAVLISLYLALVGGVQLDPRLAFFVLSAFAIGLFIMPGLTRPVLGIMGGFLAFMAVPWLQLEMGLLALLVIVLYFVITYMVAPYR